MDITIGHVVLGAFGVVYTLALAFGAQVWLDLKGRVGMVETKKAEQAEVDELRTEIHALTEDIRKSNDSANRLDVAIARLTEQMARVVSDIESEKRTRSDANKEIMAAIRETKVDIIKQVQQNLAYGRRKGDMPT